MNESTRTEVGIGVNTGDATAAILELQKSFSEFSSTVKEHMGEAGKASDILLGRVKSLVAGFLTFEGAKRAVDTVVDMGKEANRLANTLGITATEASQFAVALDEVHSSTDKVMGLMQRQSRQMKSNEQNMNAMGIATRGVNKELLPQQEILLNSITALNQYKAGTDRNQAAMQAFGGRVGELGGLLKLTKQGMEEAAVKSNDLGLTLSAQGVAAVAAYRKSVVELDAVMKALTKVLGEAVMPLLTEFSNWMTHDGGDSVRAFKFIVVNLVQFLIESFTILQVGAATVAHMWEMATLIMGKAMAFVAEAKGGSLKNAVAAWKEGNRQIIAEEAAFADKIGAIVANADKRIENLMGDKLDGSAQKPKADKKFVAPDKGAALAEIETQRTLARKAMEVKLEFYKGEVEAKRMTAAKEVELALAETNKLFEIEKSLIARKSGLHIGNVEEARKANNELRVLEAQHALDLEKSAVGLEAANRKMYAEKVALEVDALKARSALADEGQKLAIAHMDELVMKGEMTNKQKLANERDLLDSLYEYQRANLQKQADLYSDPTQLKERQKVLEEMEKMDAKYQIDLQLNANQSTAEIAKNWEKLFGTISGAIDKSVTGMIQGTITLQKALQQIWQSILGMFVSLITDMVKEWALGEMKKHGISLTWATVRQALFGANAIAEVGAAKASAAGVIPAEAATAAGGAASAVAGIPIVGPALAVGAYAETMAMVMGGLAVASAAGGYDIPAGVNPITQLHAREMVLPAQQAEAIRNMASGEGSGGNMNVTIHAVDAASVKKLFLDNGPALSAAMRRQARNFSPVKPA